MSELRNDILDTISIDEMWKHLEKLCEWDRTSGTPGEYAAVDYVTEVLESYGLPVTVHEYRAFLSFPVSAAVRVQPDSGDAYDVEAKTRAFSATTPPEGVTGEIVSVKGGRNMFQADNAVNQISEETVGGKIVLSESGSRASMLAAQAAGALGYVHMWPSDEDVIHEGIVTPVWGTPVPETAERIPTIPIISIKHDDGVRLREALEAGPVTLTLHSETDTRWTDVRMPVTDIPGKEDDFVLVAGHIDSWHYGATDNATGNVSCLELARVFHQHRDRLRRGVRVAWWVGHSTGRYSGSTWYADEHWNDLDEHCIAYINIDSPGSLGATDYGTVSAVPETAELVSRAVQDVTGQTPEIERPMRAGDQSFWGIGLPSLYMLLSNRPEGQRAAVGGCGMGWWWHSEEDLVDKAERDVLLKDTKIYAHSLARLVSEERLPLDVPAQIEELTRFLSSLQEAAEGHFDLAPASDALARLKDAYRSVSERSHDEANELTREVNHRLTALSFTSGRYGHDPAVPLPPVPSLDAVRRLPQLDADGNEYGFLKTRLTRARNQFLHQVKEAARYCERS